MKTDTISERKVGKKIFQGNNPKKQAGVATLISSKVDFQPKGIKKDKEGHFWDLMKLQSFCTDTVKRTKWQPTDWERILHLIEG